MMIRRHIDRLMFVAEGGASFQIGIRPSVSLATRAPLRRLLVALAALAAERLGGSPAPLTVTAAFEIGWPGERADPEAAATRVYTAVHSLRQLGLRGILVRRKRGYVLDAEVHLATVDVAPSSGPREFLFETPELRAAGGI